MYEAHKLNQCACANIQLSIPLSLPPSLARGMEVWVCMLPQPQSTSVDFPHLHPPAVARGKQALHFPLVMTLKEKPKSKTLLIPSHTQLCLSLAPHTMLGWQLQAWSLSDTLLLYPGEEFGTQGAPLFYTRPQSLPAETELGLSTEKRGPGSSSLQLQPLGCLARAGLWRQ